MKGCNHSDFFGGGFYLYKFQIEEAPNILIKKYKQKVTFLAQIYLILNSFPDEKDNHMYIVLSKCFNLFSGDVLNLFLGVKMHYYSRSRIQMCKILE